MRLEASSFINKTIRITPDVNPARVALFTSGIWYIGMTHAIDHVRFASGTVLIIEAFMVEVE